MKNGNEKNKENVSEKKNIHAGHRERVKQNFLNVGLQGFQDHEILEMLMFFGIPQKDTNPMAHELMSRFGSLSGALNATYEELISIKGMTKNCAVLITMMPQLFSRYASDERRITTLSNYDQLHDFFVPIYYGAKVEQFYVCSLDSRLNVKGCVKIAEGSETTVYIEDKKVVETAINFKAENVIVSHNHPDGFSMPSREDINLTKRLKEALNTVGIKLCDHVIVGDDNVVSMNFSGYMSSV